MRLTAHPLANDGNTNVIAVSNTVNNTVNNTDTSRPDKAHNVG